MIRKYVKCMLALIHSVLYFRQKRIERLLKIIRNHNYNDWGRTELTQDRGLGASRTIEYKTRINQNRITVAYQAMNDFILGRWEAWWIAVNEKIVLELCFYGNKEAKSAFEFIDGQISAKLLNQEL